MTLLRDARAAGLAVTASGGVLEVTGPRRLEPLARALLAEKPRVLAAIASEEREIAWRVEAMRPQVTRQGALPLLVARRVTPAAPGSCCSCGDTLTEGDRTRCRPCFAAVVAVLEALP